MSLERQSPSFSSSIASSQFDVSDDMETVKIKTYAKEMLKSRIFLGRYLERRLIDKRIGYRDIVVISAAEIELKRDLLEVLRKLRTVCPNTHIGITGTDSIDLSSTGVCLWTEIDNQPFGSFWFQIKSLKFREYEVIVTIKCLRHISDAYLEIEPILTGGTPKKNKESTSDSKPNTSTEALNETYTELVGSLKKVLSITNVREFITFLFAFIIAIFTGSTSFVNFLGNFVLALIREMSILVKNSTPMFLGLLDFFSKIVGGFYILLAMFFRPSQPIHPSKRTISYYDGPQRQNSHSNREFD